VRLLWIVLVSSISTAAYADNASVNLSIPGMPQSYQSDRFRAGDLDCSNAIGSATQLEFGVTGIVEKNDMFSNDEMGDVGVYARIIIPLGDRVRSRVDCSKLYELELRKKELEVQKLEQELQQLRTLQFEN
jgi:hypothetical protein